MRRFDSFMYSGEGDMLECRLTEIADVVDAVIIVEADVTHGHNTPKPYTYLDDRDRFAPWSDKIVYVQATDLPTLQDAWSRELAQREWVWEGLKILDAGPDDVVLHGDVDEIPTRLAARHVNPRGFVIFEQTLYSFAVDWQHPDPWPGTVAGRVCDITKFGEMRAFRNAQVHATRRLLNAGWHLSWLGGPDAALAKMRRFCHPEVEDLGWADRLEECYTTGLHLDNGRVGTKLLPVDVDDTWPRWIREGHAPASWFRPR